MPCCDSCAKGNGCEGDALPWRRLAAIGEPSAEPQGEVENFLALPGDARFGVWFELEPGSPADVAWKLGLSASLATVSQAYELGECNSVRVEVVTFNLEARDVAGTKYASIRVESSIDRENWRAESSTTISAAGYASWAVRSLSGRFVRIRYLGGSDSGFKSVHAVTLTGIDGPRRSGGTRGAA